MGDFSKKELDAEFALRKIFSEMGQFDCMVVTHPDADHLRTSDLAFVAESDQQKYQFAVQVRERVTPQIADKLFDQISAPDAQFIPVLYCPAISPRVTEMAKARGISYIDRASNCHLRSPRHGLLISRSGFPNDIAAPNTIVDPFSPKSSRIVRAMLQEPRRGWKLTELAEHADVRVSHGLASKVKRTLIEQNYAYEKDRLLYLKDPLALLGDWVKAYQGPAGQLALYVRGEVHQTESKIADWCLDENVEYALARFSAAWVHAAEVRYSVAAIYVSDKGFKPAALDSLSKYGGAKPVDTGANVILLSPFDESVFSRRIEAPFQTTSPLQTYLDLKQMTGRGEEAAAAVFDLHLEQELLLAAETNLKK